MLVRPEHQDTIHLVHNMGTETAEEVMANIVGEGDIVY
jgi:hypothetical protein